MAELKITSFTDVQIIRCRKT